MRSKRSTSVQLFLALTTLGAMVYSAHAARAEQMYKSPDGTELTAADACFELIMALKNRLDLGATLAEFYASACGKAELVECERVVKAAPYAETAPAFGVASGVSCIGPGE